MKDYKIDTEQIIKALRDYKYWCGSDSNGSRDIHPPICDAAADALEQLQAENERLKDGTMFKWFRAEQMKNKKLQAENERLKEAKRWIPVSEGLPSTFLNEDGEPPQYVVMIKGACLPTQLSIDRDGKWFDWAYDYTFHYYDVTHWRKLPEPPERG